MSSTRGIYCHPLPLNNNASSGSGVRPIRMLKAFIEIGCIMDVVAGDAKKRAGSIHQIRKNIKKGMHYDFCYFETATIPAALTEAHHFPLYGELDMDFLSFLHAAGIPIGVYYRDAQWRLPAAVNVSLLAVLKRRFAQHYYKRELKCLERCSSIFYVPSARFGNWLNAANTEVRTLPPGTELKERKSATRRSVCVFYVGGVDGPIYNIHPFLDIANKLLEQRFRIVCRPNEWKRLSEKIAFPSNVEVMFANSNELEQHFDNSELFGILVEPTEYFSVAAPIKLFEALGYCIPIITLSGTASAEFVTEYQIGWVVDSVDEAVSLIKELLSSRRAELDMVSMRMKRVAELNSWQSRARTVIEDLVNKGLNL